MCNIAMPMRRVVYPSRRLVVTWSVGKYTSSNDVHRQAWPVVGGTRGGGGGARGNPSLYSVVMPLAVLVLHAAQITAQ